MGAWDSRVQTCSLDPQGRGRAGRGRVGGAGAGRAVADWEAPRAPPGGASPFAEQDSDSHSQQRGHRGHRRDQPAVRARVLLVVAHWGQTQRARVRPGARGWKFSSRVLPQAASAHRTARSPPARSGPAGSPMPLRRGTPGAGRCWRRPRASPGSGWSRPWSRSRLLSWAGCSHVRQGTGGGGAAQSCRRLSPPSALEFHVVSIADFLHACQFRENVLCSKIHPHG